MPYYEYNCSECGAPFEIRATIAEYEDGLNARCPECGSKEVKRNLTGVYVSAGSSTSSNQGFESSGPSCGCGSGCGCSL
jgi:putative FmdB family regulatory protein